MHAQRMHRTHHRSPPSLVHVPNARFVTSSHLLFLVHFLCWLQGFLRGFEAEITSALAAWPSGEDGGVEVDVLDLTHGVIRRALYHAIAGPASSSLHAKATPAFHEALEYFVQRYEKGGHQQDLSVEDEAMMEKLLVGV